MNIQQEVAPKIERAEIACYIEAELRRRRWREKYLSPELLSDPAWDMMLDLYLSDLRGRRVSVTSLCIVSQAPPTTALRWIKHLERAGLVERRALPKDRRVSLVFITDQGRTAMARWAERAMGSG